MNHKTDHKVPPEVKKTLRKINHKRIIKIRLKPLADGSASLYLDIWHQGRREYYFPKIYWQGKRENRAKDNDSLAYLMALRDRKEQELREREEDFSISNWKGRADFLEYFRSIAARKPEGEKAWWNTLKHLEAFIGGKNTPIKTINETFCEDFKDYLLRLTSPNTAHVYFSKLKAALNRAVKERIIGQNPATAISIKKQDIERTFLLFEEIERLAVSSCRKESVKDAFLFACFTGLRISDIRSLTWAKIQGEYLLFKQKKTGGWERNLMTEDAIDILTRQNRTGEKIFNLPGHTRTQDIIDEWVKRAGIAKRVTFHTARHSFAINARRFGVDLQTVGRLLGHRTLQATQIYARVVDEMKDEAVKKLPRMRKMRLAKDSG